jgi:hypothetical protein
MVIKRVETIRDPIFDVPFEEYRSAALPRTRSLGHDLRSVGPGGGSGAHNEKQNTAVAACSF